VLPLAMRAPWGAVPSRAFAGPWGRFLLVGGALSLATAGCDQAELGTPAGLDASQPDAMIAGDAGDSGRDDGSPMIGEPDASAPDAGPLRDAASDAPPGPGAGCEGRLVCEDFEGDVAGGAPASSRWTVVMPDCSGSGTVVIDDAVAASGSKSLRVNGQAGYCNHVFVVPTVSVGSAADDMWVRFRVRFASALTYDHVTFMTLFDSSDMKEIRLGGQSQIMMWNREIDDATMPELSPTGIAASVMPTPEAWHCVEFHVDGTSATLDTYVDGARVSGMSADGEGTRDFDGQWYRREWSPSLSNPEFGWESYGGSAMTLWFDDIAIDGARIGCE